MKLTILSVIISLLPLIACDACGPGYFWSTEGECKECFCSGVTDKCHEGEFHTEIILTDISEVRGLMNWPDKPIEAERHSPIPSVLGYRFNEEYADKNFVWELPFKFYQHRVGNYGSSLYLIQEIRQRYAVFWSQPSIVIRIVSSEVNISYSVESQPWRDNWEMINVWITEEGAYIGEDPSQPATKADVMRALVLAEKILVIISHEDKVLIALSEMTQEVATAHRSGYQERQGIEVCDCPKGYSGYSCESCAEDFRGPCEDVEPCEDVCNDHGICLGCPVCEFEYASYHRNINDKTKSVFGACEPGDPKWITG